MSPPVGLNSWVILNRWKREISKRKRGRRGKGKRWNDSGRQGGEAGGSVKVRGFFGVDTAISGDPYSEDGGEAMLGRIGQTSLASWVFYFLRNFFEGERREGDFV